MNEWSWCGWVKERADFWLELKQREEKANEIETSLTIRKGRVHQWQNGLKV